MPVGFEVKLPVGTPELPDVTCGSEAPEFVADGLEDPDVRL